VRMEDRPERRQLTFLVLPRDERLTDSRTHVVPEWNDDAGELDRVRHHPAGV